MINVRALFYGYCFNWHSIGFMQAMSTQKRIGRGNVQVVHTRQDNWDVMRPFVRFAWGAVKLIGIALIAIVKALPALKHHGQQGSNKPVKIG